MQGIGSQSQLQRSGLDEDTEPEMEALPYHVRPRILLVEDDPELRRLLSELLWDEGYEVIEAEDGGAGLFKMNFDVTDEGLMADVDLVVSDVLLPRLTGIELVRCLRSYDLSTDVVLISAFANEEVRGMAQELGVASVLAKPFAMDDFLRTVRHLISSQDN